MNTDPLRILWVTTTAGTDGPGRTLAALLRHWPEDDAVLVCGLREVTAGFRQAIPDRIETMALDGGGAAVCLAPYRLSSLLRRWRPDIVHTQLSRADWAGRLAGALCGRPVVSTIQNVHSRMYDAEFSWPVARLGRSLDRLTLPLTDAVIAVSAGVRADLEAGGARRDRIVVIHNGFDTSRVPPPEARSEARASWRCAPDDVVVGTVALLKPQKGIRDVIQAARIVVAANPRVRFVQMGDGPLQRDARALVHAEGLGDRFALLDRVEDPLRLLPGLDLFVLPSLWEGLPVALLESMSVGLPAVGTNVSGIEEVIVDGETGRLVPPGDPASLARAILELAASPSARRACGAAARARLGAFDARDHARAYRALYREVLARRQPA